MSLILAIMASASSSTGDWLLLRTSRPAGCDGFTYCSLLTFFGGLDLCLPLVSRESLCLERSLSSSLSRFLLLLVLDLWPLSSPFLSSLLLLESLWPSRSLLSALSPLSLLSVLSLLSLRSPRSLRSFSLRSFLLDLWLLTLLLSVLLSPGVESSYLLGRSSFELFLLETDLPFESLDSLLLCELLSLSFELVFRWVEERECLSCLSCLSACLSLDECFSRWWLDDSFLIFRSAFASCFIWGGKGASSTSDSELESELEESDDDDELSELKSLKFLIV